MVVTVFLVAAACGSGSKDSSGGGAFSQEASKVRAAQETYCKQNQNFGTAAQLVEAKLLDEAPKDFTLALTAGGSCGSSEQSEFALICNQSGRDCKSAGGLPKGGTFVVGTASLPGENTLNPAVNSQGGITATSALLFNGLVELNKAEVPIPSLATSWEIRDNGSVYEFSLRPDVKWSGGQPFTAADVKFSFEAALLPFRRPGVIAPALAQPCDQPPAAPSCPSIEATEADGAAPGKVVFRFAQPYAPLLQQLGAGENPIIPKHLWEGKSLPTTAEPYPQGQNPVGTGPFVFKSQSPSEIIYERNPNYFQAPFPLFDRVVYRAIPDANSRVNELESGGIDWLGLDGQQLGLLKGRSGVTIDSEPKNSANCTQIVVLNLWARGDAGAPLTPGTLANVKAGTASPHPVLGDVKVRQAIAAALKRDVYVSQVAQNQGKLATGPFNSGISWVTAPAPLPKYDVAAAKKLLDEAGWTEVRGGGRAKDGTKLEIDLGGFAGSQVTLADKMRQDLALVGVGLKPVTMQTPEVSRAFAERNFDSLVFNNCQTTDPEVGARRVYHSAGITGAPFTNGSGYSNPVVDDAFDQAARELDRPKRSALYAKAATQIGTDLPTLWIFDQGSDSGFRSDCVGLRPYSVQFAALAGCYG